MKKYQAFFADVAGGDDQVDWWELKLLLDKTFHAGNAFCGVFQKPRTTITLVSC